MNITGFRALNVHSYLCFDILFKPDISYLDGINGSGKTTVLRAIMALLTPNIRWLSETEFQSLEVAVEHQDKTFTVRASKNEESLSLSIPEQKLQHKFSLSTLRRYSENSTSLQRLLALEFVQEDSASNKVLGFLRTLPTPMFLGLERTAQSGGDPSQSSNALLRAAGIAPVQFGKAPPGDAQQSAIDISVQQAAELAGEAYRQVRLNRATLTEELRRRLILAAFAKSETLTGSPDKFPDAGTKNAYKNTGVAVQHALVQLGIPADDITRHVVPFFDELADILAALPTGSITEALNRPFENNKEMYAVVNWLNRRFQIGFINNITEAIETHNANLRMVNQEIDRYARLVNKFLNDSGKSIWFPMDSDAPVVRIGEAKNIALRDLSSGEKQIVVILTHLSFNPSTRQANVLIIDEPEVSLHIHWQEIFVSSLREANPNTQIILATHSPSIILDDREHSVGL